MPNICVWASPADKRVGWHDLPEEHHEHTHKEAGARLCICSDPDPPFWNLPQSNNKSKESVVNKMLIAKMKNQFKQSMLKSRIKLDKSIWWDRATAQKCR
jgi:hypothetical protein